MQGKVADAGSATTALGAADTAGILEKPPLTKASDVDLSEGAPTGSQGTHLEPYLAGPHVSLSRVPAGIKAPAGAETAVAAGGGGIGGGVGSGSGKGTIPEPVPPVATEKPPAGGENGGGKGAKPAPSTLPAGGEKPPLPTATGTGDVKEAKPALSAPPVGGAGDGAGVKGTTSLPLLPMPPKPPLAGGKAASEGALGGTATESPGLEKIDLPMATATGDVRGAKLQLSAPAAGDGGGVKGTTSLPLLPMPPKPPLPGSKAASEGALGGTAIESPGLEKTDLLRSDSSVLERDEGGGFEMVSGGGSSAGEGLPEDPY